jgi:threonine dehydratase
MTMLQLPTYDDVVQAAERIAGAAHRTPVLTSRTVNEEFGAEVFFKCENMQRMGAFKFRGGYNALARFSPEQRRAGVVAFSSGNHAQAIALSARLLEIPATIIMPEDAPAAKVAATRGYGATVVTYDRYTEDREQIGRALAARDGLTLIPPYDHADVIAGRSSCAWAVADCCQARHWPRAPCRRGACCTASSPKPATMASSRSVPGRSCTSTRRARSPMARRRSTWGS